MIVLQTPQTWLMHLLGERGELAGVSIDLGLGELFEGNLLLGFAFGVVFLCAMHVRLLPLSKSSS